MGRALDRIAALLESAGQPHDAEAVRNWTFSKIERGDLKVYVRVIEDVRETRMGLLDPSAYPPEAWTDFLTHFTAYLVDRRPGISVRHRRLIPQLHWLFVDKHDLEALNPTGPRVAQTADPVVATLAPEMAAAASTASPKRDKGGRPTDRDMVVWEAGWRLRHPENLPLPSSLAEFARRLREWLKDHGAHRTKKTSEVMKARRIEHHVRSLWHKRETSHKPR
jgi:hypothetical protein